MLLPHQFLARVRRQFVADELVGVTLELIRDEDQVELVGDDEFITVACRTDPFKESPV